MRLFIILIIITACVFAFKFALKKKNRKEAEPIEQVEAAKASVQPAATLTENKNDLVERERILNLKLEQWEEKLEESKQPVEAESKVLPNINKKNIP